MLIMKINVKAEDCRIQGLKHEIETVAADDGREYDILTYKRSFSHMEMLVSLVAAVVMTLFSAGFALCSEFVLSQWVIGFTGEIQFKAELQGTEASEEKSIEKARKKVSMHRFKKNPSPLKQQIESIRNELATSQQQILQSSNWSGTLTNEPQILNDKNPSFDKIDFEEEIDEQQREDVSGEAKFLNALVKVKINLGTEESASDLRNYQQHLEILSLDSLKNESDTNHYLLGKILWLSGDGYLQSEYLLYRKGEEDPKDYIYFRFKVDPNSESFAEDWVLHDNSNNRMIEGGAGVLLDSLYDDLKGEVYNHWIVVCKDSNQNAINCKIERSVKQNKITYEVIDLTQEDQNFIDGSIELRIDGNRLIIDDLDPIVDDDLEGMVGHLMRRAQQEASLRGLTLEDGRRVI